jgi:hypothetical protein
MGQRVVDGTQRGHAREAGGQFLRADLGAVQNSRSTRVIGQRSPCTSPTLAPRNWRP